MNKLILNFQKNVSSVTMFVYLINLILISLLYNNPLITIMIFGSLFLMSILTRRKKIWSYLKFSAIIFVVTVIFNLILNQRGSNILFQIPFVKVTTESLLNGLILGISFVNLLWSFYLYDALIRVKVIFELLSSIFKSIAIIFVLTIKFIPQIIQIYTETKLISRFRVNSDQIKTNFKSKLKQTIDLNEVVLNQAIANFMNISDTLILKGYGKRERKFGKIEMNKSDIYIIVAVLVSVLFNVIMSFQHLGKVNFGSSNLFISKQGVIALIVVNVLIILIPLIFGGVNFIWWKFYSSKTTVSDTITAKNYR